MKKKDLKQYLAANDRLVRSMQLAASAMSQLAKELERSRYPTLPEGYLDVVNSPLPPDVARIDVVFKDEQRMDNIRRIDVQWPLVAGWKYHDQD